MILLLGITYHKQSKFSDAIIQFQKALKINPKYTEASLNLLITYCDLSQYDEATELFEAIKKATSFKKTPSLLQGRLANLHDKCGQYYQDLGLISEAIQEYKKAIRLFPNLPDVKFKTAKLLIKTNEIEKAQKELIEVLEIDDSINEARTLLGVLYFKAGQKEKAKDHWLKAIQNNQNDMLARIFLKFISNEKN